MFPHTAGNVWWNHHTNPPPNFVQPSACFPSQYLSQVPPTMTACTTNRKPHPPNSSELVTHAHRVSLSLAHTMIGPLPDSAAQMSGHLAATRVRAYLAVTDISSSAGNTQQDLGAYELPRKRISAQVYGNFARRFLAPLRFQDVFEFIEHVGGDQGVQFLHGFVGPSASSQNLRTGLEEPQQEPPPAQQSSTTPPPLSLTQSTRARECGTQTEPVKPQSPLHGLVTKLVDHLNLSLKFLSAFDECSQATKYRRLGWARTALSLFLDCIIPPLLSCSARPLSCFHMSPGHGHDQSKALKVSVT